MPMNEWAGLSLGATTLRPRYDDFLVVLRHQFCDQRSVCN